MFSILLKVKHELKFLCSDLILMEIIHPKIECNEWKYNWVADIFLICFVVWHVSHFSQKNSKYQIIHLLKLFNLLNLFANYYNICLKFCFCSSFCVTFLSKNCFASLVRNICNSKRKATSNTFLHTCLTYLIGQY